MKLTILNTQINNTPIRCEWHTAFGKCRLYLGNRDKQAITFGGRIRRKITTTLSVDHVSLEFIPINKGQLGLFVLRKNDILYKAVGLSLLTLEFVRISDLPLKHI